MEEEYLNLVRLLNDENAEYVVLRGHAVIAHGYYRTTGDIDIFLYATEENAVKVRISNTNPAGLTFPSAQRDLCFRNLVSGILLYLFPLRALA